MDFTLTEEQKMIRETAQNLFCKECPIEVVRKAWNDHSVGRTLWNHHLSGWTELAAGNLVNITLFMEEYGRALVPGPFFASLMAQLVAQEAGFKLEGTATVAISDKNGSWIPNHDSQKHFVPNAAEAKQIVVVSGSADVPEISLLAAGQVVATEVDNMDRLRPLFTVDAKGADKKKKIDSVVWQTVRQKVMVTAAAELVGVGRHLLDSAVAYAKERQQFGKPIGSFQGLQWKLVNIALDLERAAAAVAYAAMCIDADDADAERASLCAKAEAGLAARHCARTSLQVHAGIGYTWEHGLHYWLRRAYAGDAFMGNHDHQFAELAKQIF